jgi:site-specific recombinase XerD
MIHNIFTRASVLAKLASGPLGPYLVDLVTALQQQRYATHTIQKYLHAADALGRWLQTQQIALSTINEEVIAQYVSTLGRRKVRSCPRGAPPHEAGGLQHLLHLLRQQGIAAPPQAMRPATPFEQTLADYEQYLASVCGVAVTTRRKYLYFARQLLIFAFSSGMPEWSALRTETITQFVHQETAPRRGAGRKQPGSASRIFLRYLVTRGLIPTGLEAAIPGMRIWKHASLPEHLSDEEVTRVLTACADGTAIGRRNYAILMLLARLGIRALEAARLRLDDIDWRTGCVVIRASKNHRERRLPLPEDVGQTLLDYLQHGRPPTTCRNIFLEHTAPFQPLQTASAITKVVKRLLQQTGIKRSSSGAHLFRHTAASQMVCRGASFKEVADVLGHQSLQTTGIYAKLDLAALSQVALPWPGGAQ